MKYERNGSFLLSNIHKQTVTRKGTVAKRTSQLARQRELQRFITPLIEKFYDEHQQLVKKAFLKKREKQLVLIVNEDEEWSKKVKRIVKQKDRTVISICHLNDAFAAYYILEPDCIIIRTEAQNLIGAFKYIDKLKGRYIPMIMIGHSGSKKVKINSLALGVDEFILESTMTSDLSLYLQRQLDRKRETDQLIYIDELTTVYNRKYLASIYERFTYLVTHEQGLVSMALLDLDQFKEINDTYGHLIGDDVLTVLANELKRGVRNVDEIIRLGGEEFLILFPNTSGEQAKDIVHKALMKFSNIQFFHNKQTFTCTFSSGIHEIDKKDTDLRNNLAKVDEALYKAKNNGKNQVLSL